MRYERVVVTGLLVAAMATLAGAQALPVRNGRSAAASVGGDLVYLDELARELGPSADTARLRRGLGTASELELLNRLVNTKLVVREATTMGLAAMPEIGKQVDVASREILRELLFERLTKGLTPDPTVVESIYRESVREWKIISVILRSEAAAKQAQRELANGISFDDITARAVAAKTAVIDGGDAYHPKKAYLPQIGDAIARLKVGQATPVIRLPIGFVVVKVVDIRYPDDAAARTEARAQALAQRQLAFLAKHELELRARYAVVDTALLKSIDYTAAKPGFAALLKDTRVLAQIKGAAPMTVGDLTDYLRLQFFHGSNEASQYRRMNEKKTDALDATLARRLLNMEALRLGIDKSSAYRDRVTGFRDALVFDSFVQKVIARQSKLKEEDVKRYYDGHLKDYSGPAMMRIRGLAFTRRAAAESAVRKAREGTEWNWLAANAEGQAGNGAAGVLTFDGQPIMVSSMPDALQKAVAGSKAKDVRLYASPEGLFYALAILETIAPAPRPYAQVRDDVAKALYTETIGKNVEEYAAKLRVRTKVEIHLKKVQ